MPMWNWGRRYGSAAAVTTTWNPSDKDASITLSGGNLIATTSALADAKIRSVAGYASGKYFFSITMTAGNANGDKIGIANSTLALNGGYLGSDVNGIGCTETSGRIYYEGNGFLYPTATAWGTGDVVDVAFDTDAKLIWFRVNGGNWNDDVIGNQNPATGTGGDSFGDTTGPFYACFQSTGSGSICVANFGASAYAYAAPTGFGNL